MATPSFNIAPGESSEDRQLRRRLAIQQLQQGMSAAPVQHWTQGAARMAQALMGGMELHSEDEKDRRAKSDRRKAFADIVAGGAGEFSAAPAAPAPADPAATTRSMAAIPSASSRVYDPTEFNPLDAAVATPAELAVGVPAPKQYASLIGKAAVDNDISPNLLAAQLKQESGFNPKAVSPVGASGISQFMPATAREMGVNDPFSPDQAIPAGARYLRQNIDKFGGSVPLGLAAYNAGPGRVERSGGDISKLPAETRGYVANITAAAPAGPVPQSPAAPPASSSAQPAAPPSAGNAQFTPQQRAQLTAMLQNDQTAPIAEQIILGAMTQQMKPTEFNYQTTQDGTILRMDPRGGPPVPVYSAGQKPSYTYQTTADGTILRMDGRGGSPEEVYKAPTRAQWGVIKKDDVNGDQYGWIDPVSRKVTDAAGNPINQSAAPSSQSVTGPDGKQIPIPAGVDPKKFRQEVTSTTADALTGKKNEVQAKSEKFGNKMELAEHNIRDVETELQNVKDRAFDGFPVAGGTMATNWALSEKYQLAKQARDNFITALLRDESGAAIGTPEFNRYERELFPQPGDSTKAVEQKREARRVAIEGMKKAAGPGYKSPALTPKDGADAPEGIDPKVWKHMTPEERKLWK